MSAFGQRKSDYPLPIAHPSALHEATFGKIKRVCDALNIGAAIASDHVAVDLGFTPVHIRSLTQLRSLLHRHGYCI